MKKNTKKKRRSSNGPRGSQQKKNKENEESRPDDKKNWIVENVLKRPLFYIISATLTVLGVTYQTQLQGLFDKFMESDRAADQVSIDKTIDIIEVKHNADLSEDYFLAAFGQRRNMSSEYSKKAFQMNPDSKWGRSQGLVDAGTSAYTVTLAGRSTNEVRITDIVPVFEGDGCTPPKKQGELIEDLSAGEDGVVPLSVDIDSVRPRMTADKGENKGEPYFTGVKAKHITLRKGEDDQAVALIAHSSTMHCRWRYRVDFQVAGTIGNTVIERPGGLPFEVTPRLKDSKYRTVYVSPLFQCDKDGKPGYAYASGPAIERLRAEDPTACP